MDSVGVRWKIVTGFGGHIRATPTELRILYKGEEEIIPLSAVRHLLIMGGHTMHTSVVIHLLRAGAMVTFFDPDGIPVGTLRPFGVTDDEVVRSAQESTLTHMYGVEIAQASLKSRLLALENAQKEVGRTLFYEGEQDVLFQALDQFEFLIKLEELRRLHSLALNMYYEIMARSLPPELGFVRRTRRPHTDPVNAMLSLGYAVLFGACSRSLIGAHLDPDLGVMRQGPRSLILDFMDPLKPRMVDEVVFAVAREGISKDEYECSTTRCHLSDSLFARVVPRLHQSIKVDCIDSNTTSYLCSLLHHEDFQIRY